MLLAGSHLYLNVFSVLFAAVLGWYFGGADFSLHPDKLHGSLVSYLEKSIYRAGSYKEGLYALLAGLASVFVVSSILFYFIGKAGWFWYLVFSTAAIYLSISRDFSEVDEDSSAAVEYLNYAMPVLFYSLIFGPIAAVMYRLLPVMRSMLPTTSSRYAQFSEPVEGAYRTLRDIANLLIPVMVYAGMSIRKFVRFLKSYIP